MRSSLFNFYVKLEAIFHFASSLMELKRDLLCIVVEDGIICGLFDPVEIEEKSSI